MLRDSKRHLVCDLRTDERGIAYHLCFPCRLRFYSRSLDTVKSAAAKPHWMDLRSAVTEE